MKNIFFTFLTILLCVGGLQSQNKLDIDMTNYRLESKDDYFGRFLKRNSDLLKIYADRYNLSYIEKDGQINTDDKYLFYNLSSTGHPLFISPFETRSGRVVKANLVYPLGTSGLRLTGKGMRLGVFDQGRIQLDHQEFQGRVRMVDEVQQNNFHSTHVTGIIAAGGVNSNARGIAYEASIDGYTFERFDRKLIEALDAGLTLSNHSYGPATGWINDQSFKHGWRWYGDSTINETVDYKFGYYSDWAQFHDALIYFYPYHILVTSSGNSRSQNGPSAPFTHEILRPNNTWVTSTKRREPNGPYDSTPFSGVAKNIVTVGAVSASDPNNFSMANFSSWGPTDDGRVKPDLVGVGVGVFSTLENSGSQSNRYGNLQGTSMSSPNVAGGLLLIRQHFLQHLNYNPLASTIKGLGIHTARQDPSSGKGPNYRFGWGLLDVEFAVNQITKLDSSKFVIEEFLIRDRQVLEKSVTSDGTSPLKVTLVWTDPEGDIPPASLNPRDTILVNDIDLKVIDPTGKEFFPYILDPANPANAATKGVNYLDNIEMVEIDNPIPGKYKIQISHKKQFLENGFQILSLIATGGDLKSDFKNLYWIGGSGDWSNPQNWSETSNGSPASRIPNAKDIVRFDNSSFKSKNQTVVIPANAESLNFIYESDSLANFDFSAGKLNVSGSIIMTKKLEILGEGQITMNGENLKYNGILSNGNDLSGINIIINSDDAYYEIEDSLKVRSVVLEKGILDLNRKYIKVEEFIVRGTEQAFMDLRNSVIEVGSKLDIGENALQVLTDNSKIIFGSDNSLFSEYSLQSQIDFNELAILSGTLSINGQGAFNLLNNKATVILNDNITIDSLFLGGSSQLNLKDDVKLNLNYLSINSSQSSQVQISGVDGGVASILVADNVKYCFDYLLVNNIISAGEATLNAGANGQLSGVTDGWSAANCQDVLFAQFSFEAPCLDGVTKFNNQSTGISPSSKWVILNSQQDTIHISTITNLEYEFNSAGKYLVSLEVEENGVSKISNRNIDIIDNPLKSLFIFKDGNFLAATIADLSYQWILDGTPIPGATERLYEPVSPGNYQLLASNGKCSFISPTFNVADQVVGLEDDLKKNGFYLFPNPSTNLLNLQLGDVFHQRVEVKISNMMGMEMYKKVYVLEEENTLIPIQIENLASGIYLITLTDQKVNSRTVKFIKN